MRMIVRTSRTWFCALALAVCPMLIGSVFSEAALPVRTDANGYEIIINIPALELHLYRHGVRVKTYPIGVGSIVSPSRLGTTQIVSSVAHPTYYPPDWYLRGLSPIPPGPDNPVGTRWLGLGWSGYGIHGTNRPESIGTAASAGCIRMRNEDVEELASLVGIGTPVTFIYEPVEVSVDAVTGRILLRVHRDIYGLAQPEVDAVFAELVRIGADPKSISLTGLKVLLETADGRTRPMPVQVDVATESEKLADAGFRIGTELYVSFSKVAEQLDEPLYWERLGDAVTVRGVRLEGPVAAMDDLFGAPADLADVFGLDVEIASVASEIEGVSFYATSVRHAGQTLPWRTFREHSWVLLPVSRLASYFNIDVQVFPEERMAVVGGRPVFGGRVVEGELYLAHDRLAKLFDLPIVWDEKERVVRLDAKR